MTDSQYSEILKWLQELVRLQREANELVKKQLAQQGRGQRQQGLVVQPQPDADAERIELQNKITPLISKFKEYHALLSDRDQDTNRLRFLVEQGACPFDDEKAFDIQNDLDDLQRVRNEIVSFLPMDSSEVKNLDELNIDWLHSKVGCDSDFYEIITFNQTDRAARIVESGEYKGETLPPSDNLDRSLEYTGGYADEEFDNLVSDNEFEIEKMVKEIGKIASVLDSVCQVI